MIMAFEHLTETSKQVLIRMVDNMLKEFEQEVDEAQLDSLIGCRAIGEVQAEPGDFSKYFSPYGFSGVIAGWSKVKVSDGERTAFKYSVVLVDGSEHAIGKNMVIKLNN